MPASIICSFRVIKQHRTCSKGSLHCIYFGLCEIHEAKCYIADSERDIIKCGGGGRKKRQEWGMRERKQEAVWKTCETLSVHTRIQKTSGKSFIKQPSWCHVERDQRGKINVNSVWTECTLYQRNRVMPAVGHGAYFIPGDDWVLRPDCANRYVGVCGAPRRRRQHSIRGARSPSPPSAGFLPAADDGLAGQRQVQERLPQLKGQRILQCLAVDDQRQLVLLLQGLAQRVTVLCQFGSGRLQELC